MINRHLTLLAVILCVFVSWSEEPMVSIHSSPAPWTSLTLNNSPDSFQFAIVSDRTGGMRPGVFEDAVGKLNLLQPEFVMCVGDLVQGNTDTEAQLEAQWNEFDAIVGKLSMPFFFVPGNHDVSNTEWGKAVWKRRHGPLYYHFVYRDVLFLCLNTDDDSLAHFSEAQLTFVENTLNEFANVRWTFLFFHKPVWTYEEPSGWDRIETDLSDRPYTVFAGHTHEYLKYERHRSDYFVLGTTGAGMAHGGPIDGEFDHVMWVTMKQGGPEFANLMLDGIADKNIRTEAALLANAGTRNDGVAEPTQRNTE
jgi:predicted phosphodiesterase